MSIKDLIEISGWESLQGLTRDDIITLAELPKDFQLRDLPAFPTPHEAENLVGYFIGRHTSCLTNAWPDLHNTVKHYPKLVQQALLKACNGRTKKEFPGHTVRGYGFCKERYVQIVSKIKSRHTKIANIL